MKRIIQLRARLKADKRELEERKTYHNAVAVQQSRIELENALKELGAKLCQ